MGSITAIGLADTTLDLETQLKYHLQGNHYPPIPQSMIPVCIEAIDAYWEDDTNKLIKLPIDGVDRDGNPFQIRWRDGSDHAPAWAIIEHAHLDSWLVDDYEEDEE
jgi:hypothetical protein